VIRQALREGVIDDLTLSVVPLLLGRGLPRFGDGAETSLALAESRGFPSGLVQIRYTVS
jgi:dihydrofolate reductase